MNKIEVDELISARDPHDDLTFSELAEAYNFRNTSSRCRLFVRLLLKEIRGRPNPIRALDIGCGKGISTGKNASQWLRAIHNHVDELWGLEPDETILQDHGLFSNFQNTILENAELPENYFDLAYSYMVMEHITDPKLFLGAVHRCLKPAGVYVFITPNGVHYFTRIANFLRRIHADELILRLLRGKSVDDYHYPVLYRCNKPRQIKIFSDDCKFGNADFAFTENEGPVPYLPGPLQMVLWLAKYKRLMIQKPSALLNLYVRLEKTG